MKNVFVKFTLARRKDFPEDRTLVSVVERSTARNAFTTFPDSKDSTKIMGILCGKAFAFHVYDQGLIPAPCSSPDCLVSFVSNPVSLKDACSLLDRRKEQFRYNLWGHLV